MNAYKYNTSDTIVMDQLIDSIPLDIWIDIARHCTKHDYVALYIALPKLSRRLKKLIPEWMDLRFVRSECDRAIVPYLRARYQMSIVTSFHQVDVDWTDYFYHNHKTNTIEALSFDSRLYNCGLAIKFPYDRQLYIHLKKSLRDIIDYDNPYYNYDFNGLQEEFEKHMMLDLYGSND